MPRGKTAFEELKAWVGEDYLRQNASDVARANPGLSFPSGYLPDETDNTDDSDAIEEEIDEESIPSESDTDSDEWWKEELGNVWANNEQLKEVERARREADRLSHEKATTVDEARKKAQQQAADEIENARHAALKTTVDVSNTVRDNVSRAANAIGNTPTPGGIYMLLFVLFILHFTLIPIGGLTRAEWFWLVLTRKAHLRSEQQAVSSAQVNPSTNAAISAFDSGFNAEINAVIPGASAIGEVVGGLKGLSASIGNVNPGLSRYIHGE